MVNIDVFSPRLLSGLLVLFLLSSSVMSRSVMDETINEIDYDGRFDPSCRGEYNVKLYAMLNNVCNDCFYIFYSEQIAETCKMGCFKNEDVFKDCASSLNLPLRKYLSYAHRLQSKD